MDTIRDIPQQEMEIPMPPDITAGSCRSDMGIRLSLSWEQVRTEICHINFFHTLSRK
jgi:hypothetical protein